MNKKILVLLSILLLMITNSVKATESVIISAVVGNINQAPVITQITPNWTTELLAANSLQNFSLTFMDNENNHIYYTITTETDWWYTSPISGEISQSDYNWNLANIDFTFLAWTTIWDKTITITLNDWPNVIFKDINVYIY